MPQRKRVTLAPHASRENMVNPQLPAKKKPVAVATGFSVAILGLAEG